jgi:hypothetical protein
MTPQPLETTRRLSVRYASAALTLAAVAGTVFFLLGRPPVGRGVVLGGVFSALNFYLMGCALARRHASGRPVNRSFCLASAAVRHLLLAVPVAAGACFDRIHLPAVVAGLFSVQAVLILEALWEAFRKRSAPSPCPGGDRGPSG